MDASPILQIASASGNVFAYLRREDAPEDFDGARWARALCPRGDGLGLDGLFLLEPAGMDGPWVMEHWDSDGSSTFCSNGTRAVLALPEAPGGAEARVRSNGRDLLLRRGQDGVGLRMPEGAECGLLPAELDLAGPWAYGWIGNPQLVVEVASVDAIDLATFAPPLRHHASLPQGANVNVLEVLAPGLARIRSWERGVEGETLCCGTGCALAGAWLASRTGVLRWRLQTAGRDPVTVEVGGIGQGRWKDLWLTGPVRRIGAVVPDGSLGLG